MRKNSGTDTSNAAAPVPRYRGMLSQERKQDSTASTPKQKKTISDKKAGFELAITGSGSSAKQGSTSKGTV